jgi:hypothetical protein
VENKMKNKKLLLATLGMMSLLLLSGITLAATQNRNISIHTPLFYVRIGEATNNAENVNVKYLGQEDEVDEASQNMVSDQTELELGFLTWFGSTCNNAFTCSDYYTCHGASTCDGTFTCDFLHTCDNIYGAPCTSQMYYTCGMGPCPITSECPPKEADPVDA